MKRIFDRPFLHASFRYRTLRYSTSTTTESYNNKRLAGIFLYYLIFLHTDLHTSKAYKEETRLKLNEKENNVVLYYSKI